MKKNIGRTDSILRIIIAVILLYFMDNLSQNLQILFVITAAVLVFTALNGICLGYKLFGFSTRKNQNNL